MAGLIIVGPPILGGFVLGPIVQRGMHAAGASLLQRVTIELGLIGSGSLCLFGGWLLGGKKESIPFLDGHAGNGFQGSNWIAWFASTTLLTTGLFAMGWGFVANVIGVKNFAVMLAASVLVLNLWSFLGSL